MKDYFNDAQLEVDWVGARDNVIVGGRGLGKGKTHATYDLRNMQRMPGSNGGIIAPNQKRCLTNTLPSMLIHWEHWGFKRNIHYAIGIRPPKSWHWKKPIFEPANWENTISFYNGSIGSIISQDRKGTSNSMSFDWLDIDEAKFIKYEQLKDETFPANRGNNMFFGKHYYHHGMLVTSDIPITKEGSWFLNYRDQCDEKVIDAIKALVYEVWKKKRYIRELIKSNVPVNDHLRADLVSDLTLLSKLRSSALLYREYSSILNMQILGEDYIRRMRRDLPPLTFWTSILCQRIGIARDGFYSCMRSSNKYTAPNSSYLDNLEYNFDKLKDVDCRMDGDVNLDAPLCIAFDANANINWCVIGQTSADGKLRVIKSFYVKYDQKIPELLDKVLYYYRFMHVHQFIFYYDSTFVGNNYALQNDDFHSFINHYLTDHGWFVSEVYLGQPMHHIDKMLLINRMFQGKARLMVLINEENNEDLLISIQTAGVYNGGKDKRGEKLAETEEDRLEARTDGSDAFDTLCIGCEKFPQYGISMSVVSVF